jgi:GNAT superfamily N-acetyltransferase
LRTTNIDRASADDVSELVRVINTAYEVEKFFVAGERTDEDSVRRMLTKGAFLTARDDSDTRRLIGCVYVELRGERGYFGLLAVDPAAQGRGLGRALVEAAEEHARKAGCSHMDIRTVDLRIELPPFYRHLGYVETGQIEPVDDPRALRPFNFVMMSKSIRE